MAKIQGLVKDPEGKPIVGALVTFVEKQLQDEAEAKTNAVGRYRTKDLKSGSYKWAAEMAGFVTRTGSIILKEGTDLVENDQIILKQAGAISGKVSDEAGVGLKDAIVKATNEKKIDFGPVTTNARGDYSISGLAPGQYVVTVQAPQGFQNPRPEKTKTLPGEVARLDFKLSPAIATGSISGRITDQDGNAISGVQVTAINPRGQAVKQAATDSNGAYAISDLPPDRYKVRAQAPDGFQSPADVDVTVESGEENPHTDFRLIAQAQPGSAAISGRVTNKIDEGVQGRDVRAINAENQTAGQARTGADGRYTINDLAAAVYTVEVVDVANQPHFLPAQNVEVIVEAVTTGIDFSEHVVTDLIGRLEDSRFSVESRISEEEADQAVSLFSVVNLMLASLSRRQVGGGDRRDVMGVLNLYYGLQEGSLRDRFVFGDSTTLWLGVESELKELARDLDQFQSDIDFLNREARRQFNLGLSNNVVGNVRFPNLFRRYVEIGGDPLLSFDIKAADQLQFFDKTKIAQADELLKELKGLILQIVRSLSKYGTAATKRVNEDWARFEARALEVLQTVARERVAMNRSEQNSWVVLADLTNRNRDTEVVPYVALARHGGKLLNYAMEIYRETKNQLDDFDPGHLRNLFQRGNNQRDFWTEKVRAEATVIKRYPLSNWG